MRGKLRAVFITQGARHLPRVGIFSFFLPPRSGVPPLLTAPDGVIKPGWSRATPPFFFLNPSRTLLSPPPRSHKRHNNLTSFSYSCGGSLSLLVTRLRPRVQLSSIKKERPTPYEWKRYNLLDFPVSPFSFHPGFFPGHDLTSPRYFLRLKYKGEALNARKATPQFNH